MTYKEILHQYFGYDSFRGIQEPIIESIGSGRDTLGLMPTGGGKSITFQVPALAMEGICIVISPLIALMKDQVAALKTRGIKACAITSGMSHEAILTTLENCIFGDYKFLYISPERIGSELFRTKVVKMKVCFIAVDESHCISQWGYDFRPSYLNIAQIRNLIPDVPLLALTATATPEVVSDIQRQLHFREENVFRMSFARPNLIYVVRETSNKEAELIHILNSVPGSAIVYVRSRDKTKEIAKLLITHGLSATYYHAGLKSVEKDERQQTWSHDDIRIMVATNAFGMGIDKADVRMVIHYEMPDAPESYFQETGRGGRDGAPAYAVLLYHPNDQTRLSRRISENYPPKDFVRKVYEKLSYHYEMALGDGEGCRYDFHLEEFCHNYHLPMIQTESALRLLTQMGYLIYEEEVEYSSRLTFLVRRDELYHNPSETPDQEIVIRTLLRLYTGIFTDYAFIDEKYLARQCGFDDVRLFGALIALSRARIVSYIPARRTPSVTWVRARTESDNLVFTPAVYEERKASYEQRVKAMKHYALCHNVCRSRLLLNYFGEQQTVPCGRCDNCRRHHPSGLRQSEAETIAQRITSLLADGALHPLEELDTLPFPTEQIDAVLSTLISEEIIVRDGLHLRLFNSNSINLGKAETNP
ncbi:MAG: RecQ family ATP-dependent DNA helicase [Bacteroidaceae bacterium]|nr:RecQ family ATP-dependent DNA helicase [Bacteroidaceae bacterium]